MHKLIPRCNLWSDVAVCPDITYENARRTGNVFFPGQRVIFECVDGYAMNGSGNNVLICKGNGKWGGSFPGCIGMLLLNVIVSFTSIQDRQ